MSVTRTVPEKVPRLDLDWTSIGEASIFIRALQMDVLKVSFCLDLRNERNYAARWIAAG
jgi:hypothetical protein